MSDDFMVTCSDCGGETYGFDYPDPDCPDPDRPGTGFLCEGCASTEVENLEVNEDVEP